MKVTICATHDSASGRELLVFRHPSAGVQLPAGSVESNESTENAARRELREETGVAQIARIAPLLTLISDLGPDRAVLLDDATLFQSEQCARSSARLRRGLQVRLLRASAEAALVRYEEFDYGLDPVAVTRAVEGWMPQSALAQQLERVIFQVVVAERGPSSWTHSADGQELQLFWTPLEPKPALVAPQQAWLDAVYDRLLPARG